MKDINFREFFKPILEYIQDNTWKLTDIILTKGGCGLWGPENEKLVHTDYNNVHPIGKRNISKVFIIVFSK